MKWIHRSLAIFTLFTHLYAEPFPIDQITEMVHRDSELRLAWIQIHTESPEQAAALSHQIRELEKTNTEQLKEILIRYGLPTGYEEQEEELIENLSQLVLHSSDLSFQQQFLEKITNAGDPWGDEIDTLSDRILLRQGQPQRYGTHFHHENGQFIPYPLADSKWADTWREETGEISLAAYTTLMQAADRAIQQKKTSHLRNILFNASYDFTKNPEDYLYYATFAEQEEVPKEENQYLAFETPALAIAFALQTIPLLSTEIIFNKEGLYPDITLTVQKEEDANQVQMSPVYLYIVPKEGYQVHEPYADRFCNQVFIAPEAKKAAAECVCSDLIEPLILTGGKLTVREPKQISEYDRSTFLDEKFFLLFYFDFTLENEIF